MTTDPTLPTRRAHHGSDPFLVRLLHNRAANTLIIMAAALIPLTAFAGSAVDMGRLYVVKSRLQQACDAGVLAGRKFMKADGSSTLDANAAQQARNFFNNNFQAGWVDTVNPKFTPVKTDDQQVAGTASVVVPMTVTKIINASDTTVSVTCKARYDISDTDIIFVLDTTGSMACRPEDSEAQCNTYVGNNPATAYTRPSDAYAMPGYSAQKGYGIPETNSGNGSRIKALRQAVKDFHATVASTVDPNTRIRYGFVTYTSVINAGKAISAVNPNYMIGGSIGETAVYQSRAVTDDFVYSESYGSANSRSQSACTESAVYTRNPAATSDQPFTYRTADSTATINTVRWATVNRKTACYDLTRIVGPKWTYNPVSFNVSAFVTGASIIDPAQVNGESTAWDGCIEERQTEAGKTSFTTASYDLDPNLIPTGDAATKWKPTWPNVTFARTSNGQTTNGETGAPPRMSSDDRRKYGYYSCGKPIRTLSEMSAQDVAKYVDAADFKPLGGTYHDTGMIWGVRMLSPTGIFAASNTGRAGQPSPKKVIVFLTDGDMAPNAAVYGQYGTENYERRVSGGNFGALQNYHNARFLYECDQAAQLKIDVWTVAIGPDSTDELTQCASNPGQALYTTTGSGLSNLFQKIAKQVAMLRLDQ